MIETVHGSFATYMIIEHPDGNIELILMDEVKL